MVENQNTGWEVIEYSQPLAELNDVEYTGANRDKVIRMTTIAHTHAVPCALLGFEMDAAAMLSSPIVKLGISADDDNEEDFLLILFQQSRNKALVNHRVQVVMNLTNTVAVMVGGVKIDINCPPRVIRTACGTLGLSIRGSKKINLQRLQNFAKTQELMAAHSVETQLKAESQREMHVQKRPVEPSKQ